MKKLVPALIVVAVVAGGFFVSGRKTAVWNEFHCVECGFAANMPGEPALELVETDGGPLLGRITTRTYVSRPWFGFSKTEYGVAYYDLPERSSKGVELTFDNQKGMEGARDGAVKGVNGKLLKQTNITVGNVPALELEIEGEKAGTRAMVVSRVFVSGRRFWTVIMTHPLDKDFTAQRQAFFDSFVLRDVPGT